MKTKADYYSKILGMSLTDNPDRALETASVEPLASYTHFQFVLLALSEDIAAEKEMIQKIINAVGASFDQVISDINQIKADHVFTFGNVKVDPNLNIEKFPSFTDIAKDPGLKKNLWNRIKGFKK